ncbi:V-type proton ATPase catalytic subunit A, partial [Frankliniella fusca]
LVVSGYRLKNKILETRLKERRTEGLHEDGSAGILQGLLFQVLQLWPLDHQKELADIPEISHAWTVEHSTYLLRLHYYHEEVSPSS